MKSPGYPVVAYFQEFLKAAEDHKKSVDRMRIASHGIACGANEIFQRIDGGKSLEALKAAIQENPDLREALGNPELLEAVEFLQQILDELLYEEETGKGKDLLMGRLQSQDHILQAYADRVQEKLPLLERVFEMEIPEISETSQTKGISK